MQHGGDMTYDEIARALRDRRIKAVCEATGLHRQTVRAVRDMKGHHSTRTLDKLRAYLEGKP
jgi:hypothetical protein